MNILLTAINAKYIHSNLAVYSLRAYAGEYREHIGIAEFTINNSVDHILEEVYKRKPDVLCFSVYIWNLEYVERVAAEFHKIRPEVPIWAGGPEVSYETDDFLQKHPYITGLMVGEGERTFRSLCGLWCSGAAEGKNYAGLPGLAYRNETELVHTGLPVPLAMSDIPFAYDSTGDFSNRIIYYESSRGCPYSCSYCLSSVEKNLRFRNVELVKEELQFFIDRRVPQIKFVDRTFNCNHRHAMEIWRYIAGHDNGITNFHFEISADLLQEEELELISAMRPGLIQLEIGVQSTNDDTIREIHRTMNLEELKRIVLRIAAKNNIHQHLDLIAGLPREGFDSFRRSFDEIYALKCNQLQLGFLKVLKGSYMYEHRAEYGILYHDTPPYEVLRTNWLTYDEILQIKKVEEMLEVYYNSCQFEMTMKILEPLFPAGAFEFFRGLGNYYEEKGYFGMSHTRIRRCEILLEYAEQLPGVKERPELAEMIEEALTWDLYCRENCKSRPVWAPEPVTFRKMTREYCKKGKLSHLEPFSYRFPERTQRTITELPEKLEEKLWILFDYEERDPLDHQAKLTEI